MRRRLSICIAAGVLYAVLVAVVWTIGSHQAADRTEALLDYAVLDLRDSVAGAVDTMLSYVAESIVRDLASVEAGAKKSMHDTAARYRIDEVNVVDRSGRILASNDPDVCGGSMLEKPESAKFMVLTNGVQTTYSQPFRAGALNPGVRRKYLGRAFPGGDGYVQIGIDETRLNQMLPTLLGYIFDEWIVGEKGCFLCADMETGRLISNPSRHRDEAKTLAETGFDERLAPGAGQPLPRVEALEASTTFCQPVFCETSFCRSYVYAGHRLIAVVPYSEFFVYRDVMFAVLAVLFAFVIGGYAVFVVRVSADSDRLKEFYAAEDSRRAKDMEIAKTIQNSALPTALPESPCFRLDAAMHAARDIGGDFYDYFAIDATHIAFLVADVSGKGITAALYMMTAKTIIKDTLFALRDPAAALTEVNAELCENNPASMFLTAWVGVLDLETGIVTFANAGHNPPVKMSGPKSASMVRKSSGPLLAFLDGVKYAARTVRLAPGESLFLYTDGVTEAMDAKGELFGEERMLDALNAVSDPEPHALCGVVRTVVAAFSEGLPQADDITVLAVRYLKPPKLFSRTFPPRQEGIADASRFLDETIGRECGQDARFSGALPQLHVILDEMCSNIVRHSGASGFEVDIEIMESPPGVRMTFGDDGVAYDPLAHADPDTTLPAAERPIGGLGILMVKKMASSIFYRRDHGRNILSVERRV